MRRCANLRRRSCGSTLKQFPLLFAFSLSGSPSQVHKVLEQSCASSLGGHTPSWRLVGLLAEGGGLCAVCGRLSYRSDQFDFCTGCRKSTNECACYDPVFGRSVAMPSSRSPLRGPAPEPLTPSSWTGLEALRAHARAGALDYLSRLIGKSPVSRRLIA